MPSLWNDPRYQFSVQLQPMNPWTESNIERPWWIDHVIRRWMYHHKGTAAPLREWFSFNPRCFYGLVGTVSYDKNSERGKI